ncbi:hypothetical protein SDC9_108563 [bioreactor metagenome]|uniref:Uncharacterized protein n=1 Tax=bioreactor metagenome TaxID=1076179 RepID=A0A645BEV0_9ZZZZ
MADKYPNLSPYMYCAGNPMKFIDTDGREIFIFLQNDKDNKVQNAILGALGTKFSINKSINPAFALKVEGNQVKFVDPIKAKAQHDKLMDKSAKMQKKGKDVTEINAALKYYDLIAGTNETVNIYNEGNPNIGTNSNTTDVQVSNASIEGSNANISGADGRGASEAIAQIDDAFKMTDKRTGNNKPDNSPSNTRVSPRENRRLYKNHSNTSKHNDKPRYQDRW